MLSLTSPSRPAKKTAPAADPAPVINAAFAVPEGRRDSDAATWLAKVASVTSTIDELREANTDEAKVIEQLAFVLPIWADRAARGMAADFFTTTAVYDLLSRVDWRTVAAELCRTWTPELSRQTREQMDAMEREAIEEAAAAQEAERLAEAGSAVNDPCPWF